MTYVADYFNNITDTERSEVKSSVQGLLDLDASTGAADVGFIAAGAGAIARTAQDKLRESVSLADFCTTANAKIGFDAIAALYPNGCNIYIPAGTWNMTEGVVFTGQRMNIYGEGQNVSIINFNPASADTAFEFNSPSAGGMYQGSLTKIGFTSQNTTDKTAVNLVNCADFTLEHIGMSDGQWQGSGSICLLVEGRQSLNFHASQIACARPVVIRKNAAFTTLNTDHFNFGGAGTLELISTITTGITVEVEGGVMVTTSHFSGLALVQGKHGFQWVESGSAGASYGLVIDNFRSEQATDGTGYSFYIDANARTLQSLVIQQGYLEAGRNGIYLRKCVRVTLEDLIFEMGASKTALDVTLAPGGVLIIKNCLFVTGATITISSAKKAFSSQLGSSEPSQRGAFEVWVYEDPADLNDPKTGALVFEGVMTSPKYTVADNGTLALSTNEFAGNIFVDSQIGTGATFYLAGTNNVVSERDDPYSHYHTVKDTAGYTNIYWDAGSSRYVLQNKTGVSKAYTIVRAGHTN